MGQRLQYISYFSPFIRFFKKHEKLLQTEKTQIKRGITLVIYMGGTIWGHHFDNGANPTICIGDFLHYSITFGQKT